MIHSNTSVNTYQDNSENSVRILTLVIEVYSVEEFIILSVASDLLASVTFPQLQNIWPVPLL